MVAVSKKHIQDEIVRLLRKEAVEYVIVSVLKLSGIKAWLVKLLAEKVITIADDKIIEPLFTEIGYQGEVLKGAIIYKKVKNAKDIDEWLASVESV